MGLKFISKSGARAGQPNAHLLQWSTGSLLFDCGSGRRSPSYLDEMNPPSAVWISHAHIDHCGGVLDLLTRWPRTPVLATSKTVELLRFALTTIKNVPATRVEAVCRKITIVGRRRFQSVPKVDGATIMALDAGHIPGAAMAVVEVESGEGRRRVLYTGDFCTHDQAVTVGAGIPHRKGGFSIDAIISEAMLANDKDADESIWANEAKALIDDIAGASGPVLVGVSSIGESVEVAALCARADLSVMVDDYLEEVLTVSRHRLGENWSSISFGDRRRMTGRLHADGVVLASGDQYQRSTTAAVLADPLIGDESATLVVLNRARKKTGAGQLIRAQKGDELRWYGRTVTCQARVVYHRLINHATRWQLKGFVRGVAAEKTFLVHGATGSRWGLKRALQKDGYDAAMKVVEAGETYEV